jgi:hypothetical protein
MLSHFHYKIQFSKSFHETVTSLEKEYIGQTGRSFTKCYTKHIHDIKYNKDNSKYVKHTLNHQHTYLTQD